MRRYLTLVLLLCVAIPAGVSITGCVRNPAANYCNGLGFGLKITDVYSIDLEPRTTGVSMAYGQTRQVSAPTAKTCKGTTASVAARVMKPAPVTPLAPLEVSMATPSRVSS